MRKALAARVSFYRDLGIYDFYRRALTIPHDSPEDIAEESQLAGPAPAIENMPRPAQTKAPSAVTAAVLPIVVQPAPPASHTEDRSAALAAIREDLGDCTRCVLHKQGRKQIVFGVGNPHAEIMFVGEAPGADEDIQGIPFVGRAGQLLTNMITAMGIGRDEVYIANVIKCRPPGNRTPEREECDTCSPFLLRQIDVVKPKIIVALGAIAAKNLLQINDSMINLRGRFYDFRDTRLAVTYHPAYLLRDPRQKKEAWKDLQMVMQYLGRPVPQKSKKEE